MRILKCPHCKSTNITLDTGGQTGKYICKECGYIGGLVIQKELKQRKKNRGENMFTLKKEFTWKGWQFSVLKLAMVAIGILLGIYFKEFWLSIWWLVWVVAVVFVVLAMAMGLKSMRKK